jgi:hypothetical protein
MRRYYLLRPGLSLLSLFILLAALSAVPPVYPAAAQNTAMLTIDDQIPATAGETVQVPIRLATGNAEIATIAMVIDYDTQWLTLDPTDADSDGIPDAIAFTLPSSFSGLTPNVDPTAGTISIFAGDIAAPLTTLSDGTIATITFNVGEPTSITTAAVDFASNPPVSFGSPTGAAISGAAESGSVQITPDSSPTIPTLSIATHAATGGNSVQVPISLDAAGKQVSAVMFVLDYDTQWLTLDPTDANNDEIPDAIDFTLPAGFRSIVPDIDASDGLVRIFIGDLSPPLSTLSDGTLLSVTFAVDSTSSNANAAVGFADDPPVSFGSPEGSSIAGTSSSGTIQITPGNDPDQSTLSIFLPLVVR